MASVCVTGVTDTERVGRLHCTQGTGTSQAMGEAPATPLFAAQPREEHARVTRLTSQTGHQGLSRGVSSAHPVCAGVFTASCWALGQPCLQGADAWSSALHRARTGSHGSPSPEGCLLIDAKDNATTVSSHLHTRPWEVLVYRQVAVCFKGKTRDSNRRLGEVGFTALCTGEDLWASGPTGQVAGDRLPPLPVGEAPAGS